ncbi:30S ribosomal protein S10 [Patescibacteria group bacterium]|nr:30S ribosomal protein S10 [Patescibacteria group bacterium]
MAEKTSYSLRVILKSYDPKIVDQSARKIVEAVIRTGSKIVGPIAFPTRIKKFTVIRGPHIDKRGKEAFEQRIHKRLLDIVDPTAQTVEELSNLTLPSGVGINIKS